MPTRRTVSQSFKLFGTRVRYTTSQTAGPQQPRVQVHLTGTELMEMQRQQAEADTAQQQALEAMRQREVDAQRQHLATLNAVARWLHTPFGAIVTLVVYALSLVTAFGFNIPLLLVGLVIALAIIDWSDFASFHGAIPWNVWRAEGKNGRWWWMAILLVFLGWAIMPAVYAIQAWQRAGEVKDASRAALDDKIAALEAQVMPAPAAVPAADPPAQEPVIPPPPPPVIPPPPPPNPITRRFVSDEEYTQGATKLAAEGWTVSKVSRDKNNAIVVIFTHTSADEGAPDD